MKIGFFDSGIGGLTVLKKVIKNYGNNEYYYFGDTLRVPYGSKPQEVLVEILEGIFDFFENLNVDILISACNTTDSLVKMGLVKVENRKFKYVSIIDNGINQIEKGEKVLLLATKNTVNSGSYRNGLIKKGIKQINEKACPLFVPLVEEGYWYGPMADSIVKNYLKDYENKFDKVILGCTHYPILKKHILKRLNATIIDPADGVIKELNTKYLLFSNKKVPKVNFYITGNVEQFKFLSKRFLKKTYYNSSYYKLDLFKNKSYFKGGEYFGK
ncbi:glutamate racemase [Tepiditoga spiralis]|uniref:Glutamate racemase n=1 Tax=Tepiditoga spiralis TaxID=2108365 RepID=A0A7G1G275_9BACT|nr:glutamate racemase [Tepiditoga spiralis]BBE30440.1 glutamate racemase [Tepiditoga spiralis]